MRLVPQTLFVRTVLTLLAGLLLAQLAGTLIQFQDRGQILYQASGLSSAQRIADIVRLLDSVSPAERERLAAVLNVPPMRVVLDGPAPLPADAGSGETGALTTLFATALRGHLGSGRPLQVAVTEAPDSLPAALPVAGYGMMQGYGRGMGPGMGMGPLHQMHMAGMGLLPPEGLSFLARVRLRDGTWVSFDSRVPKEVFAWPKRLLASLAVLLVAIVALSVLAVRWLTRPLTVLAGAAEELGRNIRHPPLPETGPVEVRQAAHAFNTMQARLTRYIEDRTRMLSALSHDLKTPITRLRLRAEAVPDETLRRSIVRDLDEMKAMTQTTLDFMRGLEDHEPVQPTDLGALLESLTEDARVLGHAVELAPLPALPPCPARPLALKRCLNNLIENAVKYGQRAQITVQDEPRGVTVRVRDGGPGIPDEELEKVFEPFYRLEASRSRDTGGTGLGLPIARNIARAHGGDLVLHNHPQGGLEAVLTLPR